MSTQEMAASEIAVASSAQLWGRYEELSTKAAAALDAGDMSAYYELSELEAPITAEIDRRTSVTASEPTRAPQAVEPAKKIEQVRRQLAEAEALEATLGAVRLPGTTVGASGQTARWEEASATKLNAVGLADELAILERRLPFVSISDEDLAVELEDAQIEAERLKAETEEFKAKKRFAAARKAERLADEAGQRHYALLGEEAIRKEVRGGEFLLNDLAARAALKTRATKLEGWRAELARLEAQFTQPAGEGRDRWFDMKPITDARRNVDLLEKGIADNVPAQPDEIAAERAKLEATWPKVRGSWK